MREHRKLTSLPRPYQVKKSNGCSLGSEIAICFGRLLNNIRKRRIDLEPFVLHFDDKAADPIAVLEHDDRSMNREGNGHEERDEQADREKDCEKMLAHQALFAR